MSELANYVYEKTIDYIQSRVRDNEIRDEYDRVMSAQNYNNNEIVSLVEAIIAVAESELASARSGREEEGIVKDCIVQLVDSHVGFFGMSDKRIADTVPDAVYTDLKRAAMKWEDIMSRLSGRGRGMSRGTSRGGFGGGGSRSVFDQPARQTGFGGSRGGVFGREEPEPARASNSVFSSRAAATGGLGRTSPFDRNEEPQAEARPRSSNGFGQAAREMTMRPTEERAPRQEEAPVKAEGPDMSSERPYDDFWIGGEHWQIAHKSSFQWTWSQKQQTRRAYDIDQEVCFLVKSADGSVREEFIAMTDDLVETAHEIRMQNRPNRPRNVLERADVDPLFAGDDIDVVDLDALNVTIASARKELLSELDLNDPVIHQAAVAVSGIEEAVLRAAGAGAQTDKDVAAVNSIAGTQLAADPMTLKALESIKAISANDSDLLVLQKRLKSLRGTMAENVLNYLDQHYTTEVNSVLRDQFGLPVVSIDSFIEDFEDLLNCKAFAKHGAAYISQFLSRTRILLASIHFMTEGDQRMEFLECSDILPIAEEDSDAYKQFRENVVVLFKPMAAVHVKIASDKFGLYTKEVRTPSRTGQGADPILVDTLNSLYAIGRKTTGAGHVYLVTADNICFELVPISGARDIIGIRLV